MYKAHKNRYNVIIHWLYWLRWYKIKHTQNKKQDVQQADTLTTISEPVASVSERVASTVMRIWCNVFDLSPFTVSGGERVSLSFTVWQVWCLLLQEKQVASSLNTPPCLLPLPDFSTHKPTVYPKYWNCYSIFIYTWGGNVISVQTQIYNVR